MSGLLIAAPSSGSGKTTITLGLLRALKQVGRALAPGKAGPDYIDPAFHAAASGETCLNFDPWAMREELIVANAALHRSGGRKLVIEAMMGLFDGAADGTGSAADLAAMLGLSVVLVVDCAKTSHSVAALVKGFADFRPGVLVVGTILNRVGSDRHEAMLRQALDDIRMPVLGVIRADATLALPERHLGLVQAAENADLDGFIDRAAHVVAKGCDLDAIIRAATRSPDRQSNANIDRLPPLGTKISVARDRAFAFCYDHMLLGWRRRGAEISFFSPLNDEAPAKDADAIYLPGGYPELHAGALAQASQFRKGMLDAAARGVKIFGECGGYMVLGEALTDAHGVDHAMLGLLPLKTSFAERKRHLGYRRLKPLAADFFAQTMTGHEFHYSTATVEGNAERLFEAQDALGNSLGSVGLRRGMVAGSYMHIIDIAGDGA
ncbi:cobyrinate a,c-diamide synthase [Rhizobium oryziradicis]|uniref:Hydrogenobyrinate a,c-diamide synthase n=1 Tax=Rhizobium oryziradicis TaxID=1867956 RepID=A0A1Q8ZNX9_9HYPH|nr:cobyrinate a,c-diamide synthase [Rhizobium oryziradicis]OLP43514.1 cobyrinic acid a,c-diamide synthase [Rhizobium oryziradicis]